MDMAIRVQILNKTVSHNANTLGKKIRIQLFTLQLWINSRAD